MLFGLRMQRTTRQPLVFGVFLSRIKKSGDKKIYLILYFLSRSLLLVEYIIALLENPYSETCQAFQMEHFAKIINVF